MDKNTLEDVYAHYNTEVTACLFESETLKRHFQILKNNLSGTKILEVGCGIGTFSCMLAELTDNLTIVDGSPSCLLHTKNRMIRENISIDRFNFIESLWDDFETEEKYSDVVFLRGAEHIENPAKTISNLSKCLAPGGRIHISVPNGRSLHRKVGAYMGMLDRPESFTQGDYNVGHHHVFDFWSFRDLIVNNCKMDLVNSHGVMLKFLSNRQMTELFKQNKELPMALHQVGQELPHLCAELYYCAQNRE